MAVDKKRPSEGGSGGKKGHSSMEHWTYTQEIKDAARLRRRQCDTEQVEQGLEELAEGREAPATDSEST